MATNIWDVLGKAGEGVVKATVAKQNAKNTLKSQVLLYKIKNQFEQAQKQGEMKDKFGYDLALKQAETPGQKWAREQFDKQGQGGGNPGGAYEMRPGMNGPTIARKPNSLNSDLASAIKGDISFDDVKTKYPTAVDRIEKVRLQRTPVFKSSKFKEGFGLPALMSEDIAKLKPQTKAVISNIKNQYDLQHFISNMTKYQDAGIDTKAVMEYFGNPTPKMMGDQPDLIENTVVEQPVEDMSGE
jgi:hypothetical protein